jgi:hypothetical protein
MTKRQQSADPTCRPTGKAPILKAWSRNSTDKVTHPNDKRGTAAMRNTRKGPAGVSSHSTYSGNTIARVITWEEVGVWCAERVKMERSKDGERREETGDHHESRSQCKAL